MGTWQPRLVLEAELKKIDGQLTANPGDVELGFQRAMMLAELGRAEDAKAAYLALLTQAPEHFGALNNLGALLTSTGYSTAGRVAYAEAVKHHPDNPVGHINLAHALSQNGDIEAAMKHLHTALALDPDHPEAHQRLSYLFADMGDEENAAIHRQKGFKSRPIMTLPYRGEGTPIALLVLASSVGGTVPIRHHLDDRIFFTSVLFVDFYDPALPFPPHQVVFNAVGDADICKDSLEAAAKILRRTNAPVINPPAAVSATGRAANAERFAHVPGVVAPKITLLPREAFSQRDFIFPFLLRSPGFHTGKYFVRVENAEELAKALPLLPGAELMAIEYMDVRGADGKIRKYRVMMIDGEFFPVHAAVSHDWKVHYFSADMEDNPEHRAEDEAFLHRMPDILGARAMQALKAIHAALGLDYAGIDFALNERGEIVLFEANATMVINPPDADARWDYRRAPVQRIIDAIRKMLVKRVTPGMLAKVSAA